MVVHILKVELSKGEQMNNKLFRILILFISICIASISTLLAFNFGLSNSGLMNKNNDLNNEKEDLSDEFDLEFPEIELETDDLKLIITLKKERRFIRRPIFFL